MPKTSPTDSMAYSSSCPDCGLFQLSAINHA